MRSSTAVLLTLMGLPLMGCPPTLSQQRGEEHLDAFAAAERHLHHGRLDEAEQAYAEASAHAERRIDRDEADYRRSRVLIDQERYDEAVALLIDLGGRRPVSRRTGRALYDAARVLNERMNQPERAFELYEQIMREFPDDGLGTRSLFFRTFAWRDSGNYAAAIAYLDELYPTLGEADLADDVLKLKADIQLEADDRAGARATLEQIVRDHPYPQGHRWDEAIAKLAEMDVEDGHPLVAIRRLERMLERFENTTIIGSYTQTGMPLAQLTIARIYRDELHDYSEADSQFRRVVRRFPDSILHDDARYERGVMWLEQGERERGCDILRDVVEDFEVGHPRRLAAARVEADCGGE
ncbi:MAG: tetratricopeptide repeat protein [Myxococcales bacterium]|nr:tetratricopeptide repeat protein [Myxococcales bacterium]MCB9628726.1 tetratricopeptide repeat protein [Sandaracinaceae bacterium]